MLGLYCIIATDIFLPRPFIVDIPPSYLPKAAVKQLDKVPVSNLGQETIYTNSAISLFSSVTPEDVVIVS
jgi:hypothetical protein